MRLLLVVVMASQLCGGADILMVTMGGTKSHKIPFWELARGLIQRNHNVTFVSPFPADFHMAGLEEITPAGLVFYVRNYTDWDLVGAKMQGEEPLGILEAMRYPYESCEALLDDHETRELMQRKFHLMIVDGAYPECSLGLVHHYRIPFMYINTVAFFSGSLSTAGSPAPWAVTPAFPKPFTDNMGLLDRTFNAGWHTLLMWVHSLTMGLLQRVLLRHLGPSVPHVYDLGRNVSFILQNGHSSVTYPRPYLPNVAEIACIHCRPPKPLNKELEDFINGGDDGFIFVSMGSSVRASNMPEALRRLFVRTLGRLPQRVLWKWEDERPMPDLPPNVMLGRWLPQQDLLGHRKIRAFVTHGGLLSMFETVYHGVPVVTMPVFCDHESNAAKAELDGYAIKLDLQHITSDSLHAAIISVIHEPLYREQVKRRQLLFRDQKETPLERAVYWTEYVLRHKGAKHLQSPAKDLTFMQYYGFDVLGIVLLLLAVFLTLFCWLIKVGFRYMTDLVVSPVKTKSD